jgi:hypothetical protein
MALRFCEDGKFVLLAETLRIHDGVSLCIYSLYDWQSFHLLTERSWPAIQRYYAEVIKNYLNPHVTRTSLRRTS